MVDKIKDVTNFIIPYMQKYHADSISVIFEKYNYENSDISFIIIFLSHKTLKSKKTKTKKIEIFYPYSRPNYKNKLQNKQIAKIIDAYMDIHF